MTDATDARSIALVGDGDQVPLVASEAVVADVGTRGRRTVRLVVGGQPAGRAGHRLEDAMSSVPTALVVVGVTANGAVLAVNCPGFRGGLDPLSWTLVCPRFSGHGGEETGWVVGLSARSSMPNPYPPQFRRQAMDLVASGRTVRDLAASLGIAESCLYGWKSCDLIDRGLKAGTTTVESAELAAARRRIADLEVEVKILRKAAAAVEGVVRPLVRYRLVAELAADGVDLVHACRSLGVSRSGFYEARTRAPSARAIRHVWLTDVIAAVQGPPGRSTVVGGCTPSWCTRKGSSSATHPRRGSAGPAEHPWTAPSPWLENGGEEPDR